MRRPDLVPDCGSCDAVCCVATSFDTSEDFAITKPAGVPCPNLAGHRCAIHGELVVRGFSGCTVFDCYGAGPRVTKLVSAGPERDEAFRILRRVHELLWLVTEAVELCPKMGSDPIVGQLEDIARAPIAALLAVDLRAVEAAASALLLRVGEELGGRARLVQLRRC
jgi:hypothetical protein